jgi:peptidoglycan/xylan/chitin deacetylase (PgdA/CDA1 family)
MKAVVAAGHEIAAHGYAAKPGGKIVLPRRIKPGSVLVREWKGRSHRVIELADGFPLAPKALRISWC